MSITDWTLVELAPRPARVHPPTLVHRRRWHNRFTGVKAMTEQMPTPVPATRPASTDELMAVVNKRRKDNSDPQIYLTVKADLKFDPFTPPIVPPVNRKVRRAAQRGVKSLTDRVWDSIAPDGSFIADKVVPAWVTNTQEMKTIPPKLPEPVEQVETATATQEA